MGKKGSETTTTNWISPEDQRRIRQQRRWGDAAAQAMQGVQEAGVDPASRQAYGWMQDLYGQMGGFGAGQFGRGQQALDFAGQTGLQGLDQYANPFINMQLAGLDPLYARQRAGVGAQADDMATRAGAFGGSRSAVARAAAEGDIDRSQAAQYGNIYANSAAQAMQALMGERARMGQMGMGQMDQYMRAMQGQQGIAGGVAGMGDYFRNIKQLQNERYAKNLANATQIQMGSYGKDIEGGQTQKTEKGWAEGLLPLGMDIAKMFIPGGQAAGAMGLFGKMFGGGGPEGPGGQAPGQSAYLNQMAQDPWQGMNLGGSYSPGYGGGGGGALFNPAPAGGFFSGDAGIWGY